MPVAAVKLTHYTHCCHWYPVTLHLSSLCYGRVCGAQVSVPQHRLTPLKTAWLSLYQPITDNLKLDMRMNLKTRKVVHAAPVSASLCLSSRS